METLVEIAALTSGEEGGGDRGGGEREMEESRGEGQGQRVAEVGGGRTVGMCRREEFELVEGLPVRIGGERMMVSKGLGLIDQKGRVKVRGMGSSQDVFAVEELTVPRAYQCRPNQSTLVECNSTRIGVRIEPTSGKLAPIFQSSGGGGGVENETVQMERGGALDPLDSGTHDVTSGVG